MPAFLAPVPARSAAVVLGDAKPTLVRLLAQGLAQAVRICEPHYSELPAVAAQSIKPMRARAAPWKRERNGRS